MPKKKSAKPKVTAEPKPTPMVDETVLQVERVPMSALHLDPRNARDHDDKNLGAIIASLKDYGQVENLVVQKSTGKIIGGNGRFTAMKEMGWQECSVVYVDVDDVQAAALGVRLNRTAELASWNLQNLDDILKELAEADYDLRDVGFDDADLTALARQLEAEEAEREEDADRGDPDDVPDVAADTTCKRGDVWQVGRHRLMCGDSTLLNDVEKLTNNQKVQAVITDPPYGLDVVGGCREVSPAKRKKKGHKVISNDSQSGLQELLSTSLSNAFSICSPGAVWYVWAPTNSAMFMDFANVLMSMNLWRHSIIWVKETFVLGQADYHYRHEHCFYGWTEGKHLVPPDRKQDTVWNFDRPKSSKEHPTMKPFALMEKCISNSTLKNQLVFEPFGGSGTTLIACETTGRTCLAMEILPEYCDVILRRWSKLTGEDPVLIEEGVDDKDDDSAQSAAL